MKNFAVYKSGAGSGKTYTLVKEYLRLALQNAKTAGFEFRRINAITFTNKAAAEMKNRILKALKEISGNESKAEHLSTQLQNELNISREDLQERATTLLNAILHHYSDFAIGTIDSFTHKIVKTFAFDLQLPLNFNLETDTKTFYNKVIYQLMGQLGQDKELTHWLSEYALHKVSEDETWDPERHLLEFTNLLQNEQSERYIQLLEQLSTDDILKEKEKIDGYIKHFRQQLKQKAEEAIRFFENHQLSDDNFMYKGTGPQRFFYKCFQLELKDKKDLIGARLPQAIQNGKWANDKADNAKKQILINNAGFLGNLAKELIALLDEGLGEYKLFSLLQKQIYPILLLKKLQDIIHQFKQEEQTVFLSEFNQRISELVKTEPTPFIYERLGERYHHFLLDEFQDTGELQWQNILPLLDNALASGFYNLIVGDGKQSIYRWRNANVEQFAELPYIKNSAGNPLLKEREAALVRNYFEAQLNTNYRSTETVVNFNNRLFGTLSQSLLSEQQRGIYEQHTQMVSNSEEGYVTLLHQLGETDEKNDLTLLHIQTHINEALQDGFSYRDICIITRYNRSGNEIAEFLSSKGIPVVSNDSLLLNSVFEINVIIALLRYLSNREDSISPAMVLHYLFREKRIPLPVYHQALYDISHHKDLFSVLQSLNITLFEKSLRLSNLFDTVCAIINALGLNKKHQNALRFFLDLVNEFLVSQSSNLLAFLDWWETKKRNASLIIPDNADAVKIMSIHASKGLEFPIVIAPFCNWPLFQFDTMWVDVNSDKLNLKAGVVKLSKALEEAGLKPVLDKEQQLQTLDNLNLLYVQFTRAINRLHIISIYSKSGPPNIAGWLQNSLLHLNMQSCDNGLYTLGKRSVVSENAHAVSLPVLNLPPLTIEGNSDSIRLKAAYQLDDESEQSYAREKGILIHHILSKIKTREEVVHVLEKNAQEGLLKSTQAEDINAAIRQIVMHPTLAAFFESGPEIKTEVEILTSSGKVLRPDRLIIHETDVTILDYKTGERKDDAYAQQLQEYEDACRTLGFKTVHKYLVYVNPVEIVKMI